MPKSRSRKIARPHVPFSIFGGDSENEQQRHIAEIKTDDASDFYQSTALIIASVTFTLTAGFSILNFYQARTTSALSEVNRSVEAILTNPNMKPALTHYHVAVLKWGDDQVPESQLNAYAHALALHALDLDLTSQFQRETEQHLITAWPRYRTYLASHPDIHLSLLHKYAATIELISSRQNRRFEGCGSLQRIPVLKVLIAAFADHLRVYSKNDTAARAAALHILNVHKSAALPPDFWSNGCLLS